MCFLDWWDDEKDTFRQGLRHLMREPFEAGVRSQQAEIDRLREEIQYALDRLSVKADQGPGLRVLIDEATNVGDYFPAYELKRRLDQIHEINHHFGEFQDFTETVIRDAKQLKTEVEQLRIIVDATHEFLSDGPGELFQAVRDLRSAVEAAKGGE